MFFPLRAVGARAFGRHTHLKGPEEMTHVMTTRLGRGGVVAAAAAGLGLAAPAYAQNTTLSVSATVTPNCTVSTNAISFGNVNTISGSNVDGTGGLNVVCTNGTGWTARAGVGSGTGASFTGRRMTDGSNILSYNLFTDAGRTSVWGDGTGSTAAFTGTGTGSTQAFTIYGRVASGQTSAPAGSYADSVSVTVSY